ncbi:NYN domain-containing protein [Phyllobacterium phragmitis]|uniref:NYN domain-containing protein n=1 Tax=Phyllobacterium phragmitis TaxID=2670329 RepID=A0A2S9IQ25_9HYPH|nr:NYN domain-containing protein [Phyllobacterium phragmitis]PRD42592.1 NYN domain-containing protein [Phyllobacterium phragmitis]
MSTPKKAIFLIDGSHYDRLRSVLETPFDLRKLGEIACKDAPIDSAIYFRDVRDDKEEERQHSLFGWLKHNGFVVKGRAHHRDEPRERYGTNLVEMAIDGLLAADPGDHVIVMAADAKLAPLFSAFRDYGIASTLISTLSAPVTIAPSPLLLDRTDRFIDVAGILPRIALENAA